MPLSQLINEAANATPELRKAICEKSFETFFAYYFSEYLTYPFAPFHYEMFEDLRSLQVGDINELLFIGFGESAKTSIAKAFLVYIIAYEKRYYLNVDSFDKGNAESILFDVVLSLQTNQKIVSDFGQLYNTKRSADEVQRKKITDFITGTGIRVEAHSTQESVRGRLYKQHRPDFFYIEDFETSKTAESEAYTHQVIRHLEELQRGLSPTAWVLYCANYITDKGSVQSLLERAKGDKRFRARNYPILDKDGQPMWASKYALTDIEAQKMGKVSIEEKRRKLGARFQPEMMNDPVSAEAVFFSRRRVDMMIATARTQPPIEIKGKCRYYYRFNPAHRYAIGGDTSKGVGKDSCASVNVDFTTIPSRVVMAFDDNEMQPDVFAHELKRQGNEFGGCLVAPETNNESGGTCINELRNIYDIDRIYRQPTKNRVVEHLSGKLGWETNSATRPEMLYQFRTAVDDGLVEILDLKLLEAMRTFVFNPDTHIPDLIVAACIAWMMRNYALLTSVVSTTPTYDQPAYERPGFGGFADESNEGQV